MGFLFDNFKIALEADDITARVSNAMNGGRNANRNDTPTGNDNRDEDLTNTNILDAASQDEPEEAPEETDNPEAGGEDPAGDAGAEGDPNNPTGADPLADPGDAGGEGGEGGESTEEDFGGGDGELNPDDAPGEEKNPPSVFSDKNTLKANAIHFMELMDGELAVMNSKVGTLGDSDDIRVLNKVISNLTQTKLLMETMITKDFGSKSYEELMTRYVTMKQIYDISIRMLDKHFNKGGKRRKSSISGRNRREIG